MKIDELQKRAFYFFKEKVTIHIKLLSGTFYNGAIASIVENEYILLNDRVAGELPIYFSEIERIERFNEE